MSLAATRDAPARGGGRYFGRISAFLETLALSFLEGFVD
jgi:hypothetical protein